MRVLLAHNHYLEAGGEDQVFAAEVATLRAHGEDVRTFIVHNRKIASMGNIEVARATIWNGEVYRELSSLMQEERPDLVHFHNTFPLISPAGYAAARNLGIPVVQTLHNFRLLCPNALFLRGGRQCEDCLGRTLPWPGVVHACYRGSRPASAVVAAMLGLHRLRGTWARAVDTYITVSEFARAKFIAGGLPADRLIVKPNFLPRDPGIGSHDGRFALYVGRLSSEKGIQGLIQLWREADPGLPLRVIGSGPLDTLFANAPPGVNWLGWQPPERVLAMMQQASVLVFPTECYEGFPMVLLEAMATALPILATSQGSLPEILDSGASGVLVPPRDPRSWTVALRRAVERPAELAAIGHRGRRAFELNYTSEAGYLRLIEVYRRTIARTCTDAQPATAPV